jgi:hypothetical protein
MCQVCLGILQMESLKVVVQNNYLSKNMMKNATDYMAMVCVLFPVANKHIIPHGNGLCPIPCSK